MAKTPASALAYSIDRGRETAIVAITALAILMFVGIGSSVLASLLRHALGDGETIDRSLLIALFLNIALILFGWRKHRDLAAEIAVHSEAQQYAQVLASRDPLTGFLNRRSLAEEGSAMFVRAHRRAKAMALMMIDLDNFKAVNDLHGHAVGDALLCEVAKEIAAAMPPAALTARFGGDEFACAFLFDCAHPDSVDRVADRLMSRLAQPFDLGARRMHVSASIGVARSDDDCASIDGLLRAADIAMYAAKDCGRNRYAWFDRPMDRAHRTRIALEDGLRSAIPAGEIVPHFERQIDLATGHLIGFEALARWTHPQLGAVKPEEFIPVAEQTGMIGELSLSIMHQAFAAARDWDASLTIAVNISPWQLRDTWLAQKIIKTLTETGFPASRLEVEITESALIDNLALAQSTLGSLKNQGVQIALDDFGTGYSSLAHLRALPFDRIKIDRSFVASIDDNADSAAIVAAVAALGKSLHLPITAEGIETAAIETRLRAIGCTRGQGHHYGRPLSVADVRRLLAEKRLLTAPVSDTRLAG